MPLSSNGFLENRQQQLVYTYTYVYVYVYIYIYIYRHTHILLIYTNMYVCIYIYIYTIFNGFLENKVLRHKGSLGAGGDPPAHTCGSVDVGVSISASLSLSPSRSLSLSLYIYIYIYVYTHMSNMYAYIVYICLYVGLNARTPFDAAACATVSLYTDCSACMRLRLDGSTILFIGLRIVYIVPFRAVA